MELRHLRYFVAVADHLHFGRAAAQLQMSQPPLSQQIRRLEQELGVELFRRSKRDVQLTSAGRAFLERARHLLLEAGRAVDLTRQAARGVVGRLEVGYVSTAEIRVLPRLLRLFRRRCPQVELGLHLLNPAEQMESLRDGRIDVALTRLPVEDKGIHTERFLKEPMILAVGRGHPLARMSNLGPQRFQGVPLLMFPRQVAPVMHDSILGYFRNTGVSPKVVYGVGSISGGLGLIASGMGVSLVPDSVRDIRFSGVVYRPLAKPGLQTELAIARLQEPPTPLQEFFLKVVRDLYPRRSPPRRS